MESFSPFGGSPLRSHLPVTTTTDPMGSPLPYTTTNPMASLQNNPDMMAVIQTLIDNSATTRNADGVSAMAAMQLNQHQSATATDARKRKKAEEKPYPNATEKYGVPVNFGLPNSRLFTINGVRATYTQCKNSQPFAREKIRKVWYVFATSNNLQRARELRDDEQDITVEDCTKFLGDFQKWQVIFLITCRLIIAFKLILTSLPNYIIHSCDNYLKCVYNAMMKMVLDRVINELPKPENQDLKFKEGIKSLEDVSTHFGNLHDKLTEGPIVYGGKLLTLLDLYRIIVDIMWGSLLQGKSNWRDQVSTAFIQNNFNENIESWVIWSSNSPLAPIATLAYESVRSTALTFSSLLGLKLNSCKPRSNPMWVKTELVPPCPLVGGRSAFYVSFSKDAIDSGTDELLLGMDAKTASATAHIRIGVKALIETMGDDDAVSKLLKSLPPSFRDTVERSILEAALRDLARNPHQGLSVATGSSATVSNSSSIEIDTDDSANDLARNPHHQGLSVATGSSASASVSNSGSIGIDTDDSSANGSTGGDIASGPPRALLKSTQDHFLSTHSESPSYAGAGADSQPTKPTNPTASAASASLLASKVTHSESRSYAGAGADSQPTKPTNPTASAASESSLFHAESLSSVKVYRIPKNKENGQQPEKENIRKRESDSTNDGSQKKKKKTKKGQKEEKTKEDLNQYHLCALGVSCKEKKCRTCDNDAFAVWASTSNEGECKWYMCKGCAEPNYPNDPLSNGMLIPFDEESIYVSKDRCTQRYRCEKGTCPFRLCPACYDKRPTGSRSRSKKKSAGEGAGAGEGSCHLYGALKDDENTGDYFKLAFMISNKFGNNTTRCSGCHKYFRPSDKDTVVHLQGLV